MQRIILLYLFSLLTCIAYSQHETDNWFFGVNAGLNFSGGAPVALSAGALVTNEGCSSISDALGNLLFYTDGITIWNKLHQPMPNGTGLTGGNSSTQAALIVPQPGSVSLFNVFTTDETGGPNGFRYSVVDMTLQTGLGDVMAMSKNILIQNNVTEKLTAIKQGNGIDYWIAVHEWGTNAFYIYGLTSSGFQTIPVVSNAGMVHTTVQIQNTYGQMKFNSCGDKLASAVGYLDTVEVFDFNNMTGIVSNPVSIPLYAHVYGLEFSRDSYFLYVSNYDPSGTLVQFDLTSGNVATIIASKTVLSVTPDIYGLQFAADGKIYVSRSFSVFLGVINDPSVAGVGCNYVDNGIDLDPTFIGITSSLGLPGFPQSAFRAEISCQPSGIENTQESPPVHIYPNPSLDYFTLHLNNNKSGPLQIWIIDCAGRTIEKYSFPANPINYSFGKKLDTGIYFISIQNDSINKIFKIVKLKP